MDLPLSTWIVLPLLGGVIGYCTNYLAVRMIFRPLRPVKILGFTIQGLICKRQPEIAASIGRVVGGHLLGSEDIAKALSKMDLAEMIDGALAGGLETKLAELRRLPMIGALLTEERVADLRASIVKAMVADKEGIARALEGALDSSLDVHALVEEKVREFPMQRLEELILEVASRELRAIELLGGVLGVILGLVQVAALGFLGQG